MNNNSSRFISLFLILLCLNSLAYYNFQEPTNEENISENELIDSLVPDNPIDIPNDNIYSSKIKKVKTPGDFKTFAFFSGGGTEAGNDLINDTEYPFEPDNNDPSYYPNVVEWVTFDEVKDGDHIPKELYWRALSTVPITWPADKTVWHHLRERNFPDEPSKMFSPIFTEDWEIDGRVFYLTYIRTNDGAYFSEYLDIYMRFSLHLFNPVDQNKTLLTSTNPILFSVNTSLTQRTYSSEITGGPYLVPAGYRLIYDIEFRFSSNPTSGSLLMYTGYPAGGQTGSMVWTINDPTYGNSYTLNNNTRMAGIQLYMRSKEYPSIDVYGPTNNTVYQTAEDVTIDVTNGSISSYRWDGGTWNSFDNITQTQLPTTHGWHNLEIKASDPVFNNTDVVLYQYGYDASSTNIQLHNAISGDYLTGGFVLNFSVYDVDTVEYEWDNNGSWFLLTNPYDITTSLFEGWYDLRINTTDFYETNSYTYTFFFDSDTPIITLTNADNDTIYAPGKYLEFLITDNTGLTSLNYSWDSGPIQTWSPDPSNTYSTNLPGSVADHWLEIFVSDDYGHFASAYYEFFTDTDVFNVDLLNLVEDNYYQGGDTIELIVQRSNTTVYFNWDSDSEQPGTLDGSYLTLNGSDSLPTLEGLHTLYIRTFNLSDIEFNFNFTFWVDNTAPIISNLDTYNNERFLQNQIFNIYINDTYSDNSTDLIVQYSLDGKIYQSLTYPFTFAFPYIDGPHTLDIKAQDLAGNIANYTITFVIDNTPPILNVVLNGEIDRTSIDGHIYITPNSVVDIEITEDDLLYSIYYNWNNTGWIEVFGENFTFPISSVGIGILQIRANDSLQNLDDSYSINLVYDDTAPNLIQTFPTNNFRINDHSDLEFDISDFTLKNIRSVTYQWDDVIGMGTFDVADIESFLDGHFRLELGESARFLYVAFGYDLANLTITAEDYVGNSNATTFHFIIDITPPPIFLEYLNISWSPLNKNEKYNPYPLVGGTDIRYDNTTAYLYNVSYIRYKWLVNTDNETSSDWQELNLDDPYLIIGTEDGNHTLIFEIYDNTGQGGTPNLNQTYYYFVVDDMRIDYIYPTNFDNGNFYRIEYNDTFTYRVNITDQVDKEPIPGLQYEVYYDIELNLSWSVVIINTTIYEVTVHATNVTNGLTTAIQVYFYRPGKGGQTVTLFLEIIKKIGVLNVLETSTSIIYEESLFVQLYLENDIGQNQTITKIYVNDNYTQTIKEILDFEFNVSTYICSFNYSSVWIGSKGNFSLQIFADSTFYNASTETSSLLEFEIKPLTVLLTISVSNYTILEGTDVSINLQLTYLNGTPIIFSDVNLTIYVYLKNVTETEDPFKFSFTNYNYTISENLITNNQGRANTLFTLNSTMDYIEIEGEYYGSPTLDYVSFALESPVITIPLPEAEEFPKWLLYTLIAGSVALAAIVSLIIYRITRPKPFEELLEKITDEEILQNFHLMSPGIILTIFDQRKGPIPLVGDNSLDTMRYIGRMTIGVENFLLKIADQAYSSLGFEEHDTGRRVGSIILPTEKMIGFVHGVQLPNKMARGGFENLSLIVLADSEYGNLLLNYQEHMYEDIDELSNLLKSKKPLKEIEDEIKSLRILSVRIMLAAQKIELKEK